MAQWPFKPLAERSSRSGVTPRQALVIDDKLGFLLLFEFDRSVHKST